MSTKFVHSIKVPRLFKESAKAVKKVLVDGASFKTIVFNNNHPNTQGIYALVSETLHHCKELQTVIDKTNILVENPRFDPWLARVLITELLWGKKDLKSEAKPIITVLSYKEKLQQALVQNLDAAVDPCLKSKVKKNPRYVRINTLLSSIDETLDAFIEDGWSLLPRCHNYASHLETLSKLDGNSFIQDFHIAEVLVFPPGTQLHEHPGYLNGRILLQDKASCLSAFLLNPEPNSEVLDLCSAPGMKTTHLAAIINNLGKVYAVEMDAKRFNTLNEFVSHTNATCVQTINTDAVKISPEDYPNVEYILVDPSCSGSGMSRIEIRKTDQENLYFRLRKLQNLQCMILSHALLDFPNVKKVVYSTCSIYPEENECVVDEVFRKVCNNFELVDLKKELKNEWFNFGSSDYSHNGDKCLYARQDKDLCNGFFLAVFERVKRETLNNNDNLTSESIDAVYQIENKNENRNEEIPLEKKKKKKKKTKHDLEDNIENVDQETILKENENASNVEKCKKHKLREKIAEESEGLILETIELNGDHGDVPKKKKKKKKYSDTEQLADKNVDQIVLDDQSEIVEAPLKKKKSKRKGMEFECRDETSSKKSKKEDVECEIVNDQQVTDSEVSTKKVKKHKRKKNVEEENEVVEVEVVKKPTKDKSTKDSSDDTSIEIVDCGKQSEVIDIISTDDDNKVDSNKKSKKTKKKDKKNKNNEIADEVQ